MEIKRICGTAITLLTMLAVNAVTEMQSLLQNYCCSVVEAYALNDSQKLEKCISNYDPAKYVNEGAYILYSNEVIKLSEWKGLKSLNGTHLSARNLRSFLPPKIDEYLAKNQKVEANKTPLLRPNYDYLYAEIQVASNGIVKLQAEDYGVWRVVVASAYSASLEVNFTDSAGNQRSISLNDKVGVGTLEWTPAEGAVTITIKNNSSITVSVFLAKN
jgi:pSer/pThr/pTyr-binding forkhead associated (FHA) protein